MAGESKAHDKRIDILLGKTVLEHGYVSPEQLKAAFDEGLILLSAGSNPSKIRMLPAVNTTDEELEACFAILEKALVRVREELELPC